MISKISGNFVNDTLNGEVIVQYVDKTMMTSKISDGNVQGIEIHSALSSKGVHTDAFWSFSFQFTNK